MSKPRIHGPPYVASLVGNTWQIVIPISGKLSPLVMSKQRFASKREAEDWLASAAGQTVVSFAHEHRALPVCESEPAAHHF